MRHRGAILIQEDSIDALQAKTAHMASTGAFGAYAQNQSKQKNAFEDEEKKPRRRLQRSESKKRRRRKSERLHTLRTMSHLLNPPG